MRFNPSPRARLGRVLPVLLGLLAAVLLPAAASGGAAPAPSANPAGFAIHRGTNISHWLSQDFGWAPRPTMFTENDARYLARCGFDHVRLPLDEHEMWDEKGTPNEAAFALLQAALGWCRTHELRAIVDLHTLRSHHFNASNEGLTNTLWKDPAAQAHFLELWKQLSARLHEHPVNLVAYEIMNEPVADDHEDWNKLVAASFAVLRKLEPQRVIVIGSNRWQGPYTFPFLKVPAGDRNIILSTHTYAPFVFTHYRSSWTPLKAYTGPVTYPGRPVPDASLAELQAAIGPGSDFIPDGAREEWNAARIEKELAPAIARAKELGLQLLCSEFGCLPTVPRTARLTYYRDFVGVLEANGMAWTNWEYRGDFGILEWHGTKGLTGAPDEELLDALFQRR